ncbi:glycosyltransferase family 4 protein [Wenyingzhuangia sp. 2_MG-2023]|uniref:glycosyltransferase family 4 protein n=1 Tax=Wenyingzhuangia sp. 2_MG-2023 TaxID=3062639 RepID=UPI0026E3BC3F|nr:glycosyltransferase [Wenyingzhuangia sp. 2_MG-2023]MDO6738431.1 glycosyltransferase [Wenyingzhuangia sp. 2_MG-2023]
MAKSKVIKTTKNAPFTTITYVAREVDKEWIFGAKVKRLASFSDLDAQDYYHNKLRELPNSDGYFFIFPQYFCRAVRHNPQILQKKIIVMFTHTNWTSSFSKTHIIWCLNKVDKVICLNNDIKKQLIEDGLKPEKIEVIHIASCSDYFYPHERVTGTVGFCSAYGERKNPEIIYELVKNMPHRHFYLIGKNWDKFDKYEELIQFKNFTYYNNQDYEKYPSFYNLIDIFVSPSILEGGPVPVLEAMLSNCFPIASRTGFCPDLINHGENGYLFNTDADYKEVMDLIEKAALQTTNVRETVLEHTWKNCSNKIDQLFLNF